MEKQEKYIDDVRLSVIKKEKGIENKKTKKKYNNLVHMDQRVVSKNIMKFVRPESLSETFFSISTTYYFIWASRSW